MYRLNLHHLYLDIYTTYHSAFLEWYLKNIPKFRTVLHGHCDAGTTLADENGYYGAFYMCMKNKDITNLRYISQMEKYSYLVTYDIQGGFIVHTPEVTPTVFKKYTVLCNHMPYINM